MNCTGKRCLMQFSKVDPSTCKCVSYCPQATPPKTNADKIRAMTDEELAVWIAETSCCSDWCILRDACDKKQEHECCINVWFDWLKREGE